MVLIKHFEPGAALMPGLFIYNERLRRFYTRRVKIHQNLSVKPKTSRDVRWILTSHWATLLHSAEQISPKVPHQI
jgi:hypothetical protein